MRLLIVTPAYPPFPGGGERFVGSLTEVMAARGHEITVVTSAARTEKDFWSGTSDRREPLSENRIGSVQVLRQPLRRIFGGRDFLFAWRKAMVLISSLPGDQSRILQRMAGLVPPISGLEETLHDLPVQFDIVHAFNISWEYALVQAWKLAKSRGLPLVVTPYIHTGGVDQDRVVRNATMDHQRRILNEAEAVLVLTRIESEFLDRQQLAPKAVEIIGAGLDPLPPTGNQRLTLERYNLQKPLAIFVGRATYDKGAIHAVQAVLKLRQQGSPLILALIGQPSAELYRLLARLTDDELLGIRHLGIVDEIDKHTLLEAADMLLLPSQVDSLGIVILEAWAHGAPVIGARSGGIPAVIDDNENGFLVDFGDVNGLCTVMERLLIDPELGKKMGNRGRLKVESLYTWDKVADRVLACYDQIVAA